MCFDQYSHLMEHSPEKYEKIFAYTIPQDRLITVANGDVYLLSDGARLFLWSLIMIVEANNQRECCIAPSFTLDNLLVSLSTGEVSLRKAVWYDLNSTVGTQVMNRRASFVAAITVFVQLLQIKHGNIKGKLCLEVWDLFNRIDRFSEANSEDLLMNLNHPPLLPTKGRAHLIEDIDTMLRHEFRNGGAVEQRKSRTNILICSPYLGNQGNPTPFPLLTTIVDSHPLLNHWYYFTDHQQNVQHPPLLREGHKASDYNLLLAGSKMVALNRDGVKHLFPQVQNLPVMTKLWPYKLTEVLDVLRVNNPMLLPETLANILKEGGTDMWTMLELGKRWPKNICHIPLITSPLSNGRTNNIPK